MEIGVEGFGPHKWPSVERTRRFYERALSAEFDLRTLGGAAEQDFAAPRGALLSFYGWREECREILPAEGVDFIVGFVGRLLPQRNLHQFLRLLAELKRRVAPRKVAGLVIGNYWVDYPVLNYVTEGYRDYIGGLVGELGLADDLIYLPARLSDEELAMCYAAMDILVHPTNALDENFGYVPVEAMSCGTPVVGAAYGGVKDSVVSGETGFLMPTWVTRSGIRMDLISGLEEATRLLLDREARARMSEAAARRVRGHYTEEACAARLVAAVKRAVERRRAGDSRPVTMAPPRPPPSHRVCCRRWMCPGSTTPTQWPTTSARRARSPALTRAYGSPPPCCRTDRICTASTTRLGPRPSTWMTSISN
ncbi:MAG: glycosyltransferase [Acidobacteria bacterium]|nr:glycosyltransferase [Acidobacteriota bacterium]MCA1618603.1 glycosyltransferase [Acidobacteriota bacterium]